ncbi:MAG: CPBP family glutamic-type intramembrane protease [Chloroflexota bacterium]
MKTTTSNISSVRPVSVSGSASSILASPWFMLVSRSVLFLLAQLLITMVLAAAGTASAWDASARWWTFMAIPANIASIYLLVRNFRAEGKRYFDVIRFSRATLKTDLLVFFGSSLIGIPIAAAPMNVLGTAIFGDRMIPINMMFIPLPAWALVVSLLFPLTIGFAELTTYCGYVMPRLEAKIKNGWAAWLIASFFLGAQHMFLPLILDGRFMLWRLGMYMPFALFAGLMLKLRPSLLPYFMIVHALVDLSAVSVYLML